jgi:hypothetical protein
MHKKIYVARVLKREFTIKMIMKDIDISSSISFSAAGI